MRIFLTFITLLLLKPVLAQNSLPVADSVFNLGFEKTSPGQVLPDRWVRFNPGKGYICKSTSDEKHSGERSLLIEQRTDTTSDPAASIMERIPAKFKGKQITFSAYLKYKDVKNFIALLIRIDNAYQKPVAFQTLQYRRIHGSSDWKLYRVKVPLPLDAQNIYVAAILAGPGELWMDDASITIDGKDISKAAINTTYNPNPHLKPEYGDSTAVSGRIKLKTTTLYYEVYGSGEPLLLLHGNSQSIYAFTYQIGELSKYYKVIAVDTRGQGKSTDDTMGPLNYDMFAKDMKQLLDSLHIKKANILGWSDGGNTGLTMAIKYPSYVNKLAVMGANLFPNREAVPDSILKQVKEGIKHYKKLNDAHSRMEVRLFTMLLNEPRLTFAELKQINAPVLVMAGEHDIILEKHTRAIAAAIPNSRLVIFRGASHYAPVEIPGKFNQTVLDFFRQ